MKSRLSEQQKKVAYELVTSDITGKTIKEIAEEHGISERQVYRWKNDPIFARELEHQADVNLKSFYSEATQKLKDIVRNGNSEQAIIAAVKLVMQSQGKLRDVQEITTHASQDIVSNGVSEDLRQDIEDILKANKT